ncbi:MAG: DUF721 domain-containing protein [Flavobacteriales bacterium]|nr:DUF721 domain-containing protein [Flavobacteriales bacterium]
MKRGGDEESIGSVLKGLVKIYGMDNKFNELDAIGAWKEIMGPAITAKTRRIIVRNSTLIVYLDSGVLKEEFAYAKEKLINLMNDHLGKKVITEVEIY